MHLYERLSAVPNNTKKFRVDIFFFIFPNLPAHLWITHFREPLPTSALLAPSAQALRFRLGRRSRNSSWLQCLPSSRPFHSKVVPIEGIRWFHTRAYSCLPTYALPKPCPSERDSEDKRAPALQMVCLRDTSGIPLCGGCPIGKRSVRAFPAHNKSFLQTSTSAVVRQDKCNIDSPFLIANVCCAAI